MSRKVSIIFFVVFAICGAVWAWQATFGPVRLIALAIVFCGIVGICQQIRKANTRS